MILSLLAGSLAKGQIKDFQSWTGVQLNVDLPKKFTLAAATQLRLENNLQSLNQIWGELNLSRDMGKHFSLTAGARYKYALDANTLRTFVDVQGSYTLDLKKIGIKKYHLNVSARVRFQRETDYLPLAEYDIRPKVKISLERKKWKFTPWIAWEEYYSKRIYGFDQSRLRGSAGVEFNLKKSFTLNTFYMWQVQRYTTNPVQANIIGLTLKYDWKPGKGKSKTDPEPVSPVPPPITD